MVTYNSVKNKEFTYCVVCGAVRALQARCAFLSKCCGAHGTCVCYVTYAHKEGYSLPCAELHGTCKCWTVLYTGFLNFN